jgi:hypothetical protein
MSLGVARSAQHNNIFRTFTPKVIIIEMMAVKNAGGGETISTPSTGVLFHPACKLMPVVGVEIILTIPSLARHGCLEYVYQDIGYIFHNMDFIAVFMST